MRLCTITITYPMDPPSQTAEEEFQDWYNSHVNLGDVLATEGTKVKVEITGDNPSTYEELGVLPLTSA